MTRGLTETPRTFKANLLTERGGVRWPSRSFCRDLQEIGPSTATGCAWSPVVCRRQMRRGFRVSADGRPTHHLPRYRKGNLAIKHT